MDVQVTYVSGHVSEVKRARITCWLNDRNVVVELRGGGDRVITSDASTIHEERLKVASTMTTGSMQIMPLLTP
jgi:flagellar biosynthesis/type III secretory pathway M-ring protein FliF/YscJ